jgi:hypothetical protein
MSKTLKEASQAVANSNFDAAKTAAVLSAASVANRQIAKLVASKAPLIMRGYVDTTFGKLILANIAAQGLLYARPNDPKINTIAEAMMVTAYQDVISDFDIDGMIDDFLNSAQMKKALKSIDWDAEEGV